MDFLIFELSGNRYTVALSDVDEILHMAAFKIVPNAPEFVSGIINLHGVLLPVVDILPRLGMTRKSVLTSEQTALSPFKKDSRLLIVSIENKDGLATENEKIRLAIIFDGWKGLIRLTPEEIRTNIISDEVMPDYIQGTCIDNKNTTIMQGLNLKKILKQSEINVLKNSKMIESSSGSKANGY